jgi:hypothetical protein
MNQTIKSLPIGSKIERKVKLKTFLLESAPDPSLFRNVTAFNKVETGILTEKFFQLDEWPNDKIRPAHEMNVVRWVRHALELPHSEKNSLN